MVKTGRHFLQIPGPTNVPDRILRAIDQPTIDHRGPEFAALGKSVIAGMKRIFQTTGPVVVFPSSGTGAWEAALVNTLSPGDRVLAFETGHFATLWHAMAKRLSLEVEFVAMDWRHPVDAGEVEARLGADKAHAIKAVMVVHNETSTAVTSDVATIRLAIDRARHPALLMVDTISSLASIEYRHEAWGVDVTVGGSQKGLMLPPGLSFNAISAKALVANKRATLPRAYWDWQPMLAVAETGYFPFTPATNLLFGLREAILMLEKDSRTFLRDTRAWPRRRGARCGAGSSSSCRSKPRRIPIRSPPCCCLPAMTPTRCAARCSSASTCRSAPGSARSRARCFASAISAGSTS